MYLQKISAKVQIWDHLQLESSYHIIDCVIESSYHRIDSVIESFTIKIIIDSDLEGSWIAKIMQSLISAETFFSW